MAIYSFDMKNITRSNHDYNTNICASIAYITCERIHCDRNNKTYQYGRKERVLYTNTILPIGAPINWQDPKILWNEIESYEKNANARLGKILMFALPHECNMNQDIAICEEICKILQEQGIACTYAIHGVPDRILHDLTPVDKDNIHAHVILANRVLGADGKWKCKKKQEYLLDENGERVPRCTEELDEKGNPKKDENGNIIYKLDENGNKIQKVDAHGRKQWVRHSVESNPMDKKDLFITLRTEYERICNQYLDDEHKIDHRSYEEQGIDKIPTIHEGWYARKIEEDGGISEKCEYNRHVRLQNEIKALDKEIAEKETHRTELTEERTSLVAQAKAMLEDLGTRLVTAKNRIVAVATQKWPERDNWNDGNKYHNWHDYDPNHDYINNTMDALFVRSSNQLTDAIIQSDLAKGLRYMQVGLNLNRLSDIANAVTIIEKYKIDSRKTLRGAYDNITQEARNAYKEYKTTDEAITAVNKKIKQCTVMDKNQEVWDKYANVKDKTDIISKRYANSYYRDHKDEIDAYSTAYQYLRTHSSDGNGKPESLEKLKAERKELRNTAKEQIEKVLDYRNDSDILYATYNTLMLTLGKDKEAPDWTPADPLPDKLFPAELQREHKRKPLHTKEPNAKDIENYNRAKYRQRGLETPEEPSL